jgi:DNA-binding transcriptional MerR regulator
MPQNHYLRTSELARAVGIHPNTVRLYEQWGFLPPVPRTPKGYRCFSEFHLDQLRLARLALHCTVIGGDVRRAALQMVHQGACHDLQGALDLAHQFVAAVQAEMVQAEAVVQVLETWAQEPSFETGSHPLHIGDAARLLNTTVDSLHNWERNGLLEVPRAGRNGYRLYGSAEIGRARVIRMLIRSGYSLMSILRMLTRLDQGQTEKLRQVLDTPSKDEDALYVSDRWLSTLAEVRQCAVQALIQVEEMLRKYPPT